jgi:hypothetical protein
MAILVVATRRFLLRARCPPGRVNCAWRASLSKQDDPGRLRDCWRRVDLHCFRVSALHCWPCRNRVEPPIQVWKFFEPHRLPLVRNDPWVGGDIGDRVNPGDEFAILQAQVKYRIQPLGLSHVTVDGVRNLLGAYCEKWWFCPSIGPSPPTCQNSHCMASVCPRRSAGSSFPVLWVRY